MGLVARPPRERGGLGKLRHLDVENLGVQEKVKSRKMEICKVLGAENPADIFTKDVEAAILERAMKQMYLYSEEGRAESSHSTTTGTKQAALTVKNGLGEMRESLTSGKHTRALGGRKGVGALADVRA